MREVVAVCPFEDYIYIFMSDGSIYRMSTDHRTNDIKFILIGAVPDDR